MCIWIDQNHISQRTPIQDISQAKNSLHVLNCLPNPSHVWVTWWCACHSQPGPASWTNLTHILYITYHMQPKITTPNTQACSQARRLAHEMLNMPALRNCRRVCHLSGSAQLSKVEWVQPEHSTQNWILANRRHQKIVFTTPLAFNTWLVAHTLG